MTDPDKPIPLRPEPVLSGKETAHVDGKSDMKTVAGRLLTGMPCLVKDAYPTGIGVLSELKKQVFGKTKAAADERDDHDFQDYRTMRSDFRQASNRLLVPVEQNRIALRKSPDIGWLRELYPDVQDFLLPFPQIQGLNSSWQWFLRGVRFPVLKHEIYPWYGIYFPTRFDHLLLFDEWLGTYRGRKETAMDVGAGCGVLSFMLLEHGFRHVTATDINPSAVITIRENARHQGVQDRLEAHMSDLFTQLYGIGEAGGRARAKTGAETGSKSDLIVFNPPWLPAREDTGMLDRAIYYDSGLFKRFFSDTVDFLAEGGKLAVFFSNLGRTTGIEKEHPVEEELARFKRFRKVERLQRKVAAPSRKTRRKDHRKDEWVELWVLERR